MITAQDIVRQEQEDEIRNDLLDRIHDMRSFFYGHDLGHSDDILEIVIERHFDSKSRKDIRKVLLVNRDDRWYWGPENWSFFRTSPHTKMCETHSSHYSTDDLIPFLVDCKIEPHEIHIVRSGNVS